MTVEQESAWAVLRQRQEVSRPPAYFTFDWRAARQSVKALAQLEPTVAATGHGVPMRGERSLYELKTLAENFDRLAVPERGRYVRQPAVADGTGVVFVPPPVPNPFSKVVGGVFAVAATAVVINQFRRQRRRRLAFEK